jgi:NAD(P)H-binding
LCALARSARRIPVDHPKLTKMSADARDQAAVTGALEGVDAVIQALGIPGRDMMLRPVHLFSDATRVLIASMEETGVKRLIAVTGFGAGDSRNRGGCLYNTAFHLFLGRAYDDKDEQEAHPRQRTGLGDCSSGHPDQRIADGQIPRPR